MTTETKFRYYTCFILFIFFKLYFISFQWTINLWAVHTMNNNNNNNNTDYRILFLWKWGPVDQCPECDDLCFPVFRPRHLEDRSWLFASIFYLCCWAGDWTKRAKQVSNFTWVDPITHKIYGVFLGEGSALCMVLGNLWKHASCYRMGKACRCPYLIKHLPPTKHKPANIDTLTWAQR